MKSVLCVLLISAQAFAGSIIVSCNESNDLYQMIESENARRFDSPTAALNAAGDGASMMMLASDEKPTGFSKEQFDMVKKKHLKLYVELPDAKKYSTAEWERVVVASDSFGETLPKLRILAAHSFTFPTIAADENALLVVARVAGFDRAVYGLPKKTFPLLTTDMDGNLIAYAPLSNFVTARYAPAGDWTMVWKFILKKLDLNGELKFEPIVRPAFDAKAVLPVDVEKRALDSAARWILNSRLLPHLSYALVLHELLSKGIETTEAPSANDAIGDGSCGILEGYASQIFPDGSQRQRTPIRADCCAESAMVLALGGDEKSKTIAANLLDFTFGPTMQTHGRLDPKHPAFGLIAWGAISPGWETANYGDDNGRTIIATALAGVTLDSPKLDKHVLRALLANLRTTGTKGFRGDRIDIPALEKNGWKYFHDAPTVNVAPHFESQLWACDLWAYSLLHEPEFLAKPRAAMRETMAAYPNGWRFKDNVERSRFLLPLAWLVRVDDSPEHREWLARDADDLLKYQDACGAIREHFATTGGGHYQIPQSNEAYGTGETPLIQSNDDPASDQLYTTGFALLALHETAAATGDAKYRAAEDRLAQYLCRIQTHSEKRPELNGWWFRAFDFKRWEYWSSSADIGWGAWSLEAGWAQSWAAATFSLRAQKVSLWEILSRSHIAEQLDAVRKEMATR